MAEHKIFDMHTHAYTPGALEFMQEYMASARLDGIAIASFGCDRNGCVAEQNILPLIFKAKDERIMAYGSLIYPSAPATTLEGKWNPVSQAKRLLQMGFDGIKILESKPDSRKLVGLSLSGEAYREFFEYLEEAGVPVLWHVADPPEFWDAERAPAFAREAGWIYDDSFLPWDEIIGEALDVVERHKRLKVIFAHFFFHSQSVARSQEILDAHPNVSFDLTPGIEMYINFTQNADEWREFFIRNCDRIMFGTDADEFCADIMCEDEKSPSVTVGHIRHFLETDERFEFWGRPVKGLALPQEVLMKLYCGNFMDSVRERKSVDLGMLREYAFDFGEHIYSPENRAWIQEQLFGDAN